MTGEVIYAGLFAATLLVYLGGLWLFRRCGQFPLLHPLVVSSSILAAGLIVAGIDYGTFKQANTLLYLLLGPATVALAVPMHLEFHRIREAKRPIVITLIFGAIAAPAAAILIAWLMGGDSAVLAAMYTKSISTPIALAVAEISTQAYPGLIAGIVVFTGVVAAIVGTPLFRLMKIRDHRIQGIALGINGHAAGTTRGFEISRTCGAFSSLALGLTGCLTAILLPLLMWLINFG
ncbi:MAG: LrgB family protein [bacterium]